MSVKAAPSTQVFGNQFLRPAILSFLPLKEQDLCKGVNNACKQNVETIQRRDILSRLTPEQINAFGRARLENAPIQNFPRNASWEDSPYASFAASGASFNALKLRAPFVIGFHEGDDTHGEQTYAAVRVKHLASGRGCFRRFSLKVHEGARIAMLHVKPGAHLPEPEPVIFDMYGRYDQFEPLSWSNGFTRSNVGAAERRVSFDIGIQIVDGRKPARIQVLTDLVEGKTQIAPPVIVEVEATRERYFSSRLFACFRRCCFKTGQRNHIKID